MTACMYISHDPKTGDPAPHTAVLIADTLWTVNNRTTFPVIVPANVSNVDDVSSSQAQIVRKLYIVKGRLAVAFAGDGRIIKECYKYIRSNVDSILTRIRPMVPIQDWANKYVKKFYVLAAAVKKKTSLVNHMEVGDCCVIGPLGQCYITGSVDARRRLRRLASLFAERFDSERFPGCPGEMFAVDLNAIRLAEEMAEKPGVWGGYVEYVKLDLKTRKWIRGPRAIHMFARGTLERGIPSRVELSPRVVAYDPGKSSGRIISATLDTVGVHEFPILNISPSHDLMESNEKDLFWRDWVAEVVSITTIVENERHEFDYVTHVMQGSIANGVKISVKEEQLSLDLSPKAKEYFKAFLETEISAVYAS